MSDVHWFDGHEWSIRVEREHGATVVTTVDPYGEGAIMGPRELREFGDALHRAAAILEERP